MNDFFSTFNPDILEELRDLIVCTVPRYHCTRYRIIMHHLSLDFNHEVFSSIGAIVYCCLGSLITFSIAKNVCRHDNARLDCLQRRANGELR